MYLQKRLDCDFIITHCFYLPHTQTKTIFKCSGVQLNKSTVMFCDESQFFFRTRKEMEAMSPKDEENESL